jgi:hypothetical protein
MVLINPGKIYNASVLRNKPRDPHKKIQGNEMYS